MKRKLNYFGVTAAAAALMLASCSQELEEITPITGGDVDVTLVVSPEGLNEVTTYSVSDMDNPTDSTYYLRYVMEVYADGSGDEGGYTDVDEYVAGTSTSAPLKVKRMVKYVKAANYSSTSPVQFEYRVPQGTYQTLVWVDYVTEESADMADEDTSDDGSLYNVENLYNVSYDRENGKDYTVAESGIGMEFRDAFAAKGTTTLTGTANTQSLSAKHIVAKVNLNADDFYSLYTNEKDTTYTTPTTTIKSVKLTYTNSAAGYNVAKGSGTVIADEDVEFTTTFTYDDNYTYNNNSDVVTILSDYMLANTSITDVKIDVEYDYTTNSLTSTDVSALSKVIVTKQYQTNILGSLLSTKNTLSISLNEAFNANENNIMTGTTIEPGTLSVGMSDTNPAGNGAVEINAGTISLPALPVKSTEATISDYIAFVIPQNSAVVGESDENIIKSITLEPTYESSGDYATYNVMVTFNENKTGYMRQVALKIYYTMSAMPYMKEDATTYTYTNAKSYTQTLYQAPNYNNGYASPSLYYISGVDGSDTSTNALTGNNISLISENEIYKITSPFGLLDAGDSKYYNTFDVVVRTNRSPSTLTLVASSNGENGLNNTYSFSTPAEVVTSATNWATKEWSATERNYLKYTVKVTSNVTLSEAKEQIAKIQFKDYPMLALGVAAPTVDDTKLAGTNALIKTSNDKTVGFQIEANNVYTTVTDTNSTASNIQYGEDGEYYSVNGGKDTRFTVTIKTNKYLDTTETNNIPNCLEIGTPDVLKLVDPDGYSIETKKDSYGVQYTEATFNFELEPYTGTSASANSKYTISATTDHVTTAASAYSKTVYQCGNYHALSYGILDTEGTFKGYGYLSGSNCVYATVDKTKTITADEDDEFIFYIRTNMVSSIDALLMLFDAESGVNAITDQITITKKGAATVNYSADYWKVYNFGNHMVFEVKVNVPKNESTTATAKYVYSFPDPNSYGLTPTVTITRAKAVE